MPNLTGSEHIAINAPTESIYKYITDFPKHVDWNDGLLSMTHVNSVQGVGAQYHTSEKPPEGLPKLMEMMIPIMNKLMGLKDYTEAEVTELVENQQLAWEAGLPMRGGYMMRSNWTIELTPNGHGTQMTQSYTFMPQHMMAKMALDDAQAKRISDGVKQNLQTLKSILE